MTELAELLPESVRDVIEDPSRLGALSELDVRDGPSDDDFERLSSAAAHLFDAEMGLVTLIGNDRIWFRACHGAALVESPLQDLTFFGYNLAEPDGTLIVSDTFQDERFSRDPQVTGWPNVRFYAGAPIIIGGQKIGTLSVLGRSPRNHVNPDAVDQLRNLAALASALFKLKEEAQVRARTAAALLREEWRHALTLEAGKVGSWVWEVRTGELSCNDMFRRMYGLPEFGAVTIHDVLDATHPADRAMVEAGIAASLTIGVDYDAEARVADTGKWLTMRGRVYQRDQEGNPLIVMGSSFDISESKQSAEHTKLLLRELNHRVKNTLAMIQSVARQTIRQTPDPKAFIEAFSGRLRTISDAHVLLADRDWSGVQLYEVIASQLGPNFLDNPDRALVHGEDVTLPADHAVGLGLLLHELMTNAYRYGAWSGDKGMVHLEWDLKGAEQPEQPGLSLKWRESGGPRVDEPENYGLGAKLIERSLAKVLGSEVDLSFPPEGVVAQVWLPLPVGHH